MFVAAVGPAHLGEAARTSWRASPQVAEACARMLSGHRLGRLLDAGGGEGFVTAYLMRRRAVDTALVLDRDEAILAEVPAPIQTKRGWVEDLDSADGEFSTILLRQVLHYFESPAANLRRLGDRLGVGGVLYVGQLIAPSRATARWLGETAGWVSPSRHRVFTMGQLLATFVEARLSLIRAAIVPERLLLAAKAINHRPATRIVTTLEVRDEQGTLSGRVYWLHALLRTATRLPITERTEVTARS